MNLVTKETGYFNSFDGTPIYYESRGEGEPIVFIYGIACLMNHWHHQVKYFSDNYRVILFDIRGHHLSNPIHDVRNLGMDSLSKDLILLLEHLNIPKAHFVGHSFGVPYLLQTYKDRPEIFKSIIFINGFSKNPIKNMYGLDVVEPFYRFVKSQFEINPDLWTTLWKSLVDNPVAIRLAALAGGFNFKLTHFKDMEIYAKGVAQMDLQTFLLLFEHLMSFDGDEVLKHISVPTLIIAGENDHVTPASFQKYMHDMIKGSELMTVPYGSHCTMLDFPDYVNLKIDKFYSDITAQR